MRRYFIELGYNGANYSGWQRQPNAPTIQQTLEEAFSLILGTPIEILGCGRTDARVHAKQYFAHFDMEKEFEQKTILRLNKYLPADIVLYRVFEVREDAHARFDAYHRSYEYHLDFHKNPFRQTTIYHFPFPIRPTLEQLNEAASLLLEYEDFFPFCKSNTDVKTMRCEMKRAEWVQVPNEEKYIFHISANRFLRGMVRLIVGMCLNVANGRVSLEEVREALDKQIRMTKDMSVAAEGLFLTDIRYPDLGEKKEVKALNEL